MVKTCSRCWCPLFSISFPPDYHSFYHSFCSWKRSNWRFLLDLILTPSYHEPNHSNLDIESRFREWNQQYILFHIFFLLQKSELNELKLFPCIKSIIVQFPSRILEPLILWYIDRIVEGATMSTIEWRVKINSWHSIQMCLFTIWFSLTQFRL